MHAIGVDIGGTKIAGGVVDGEGRVLATTRRDTAADDPIAIERAVVEVYRELSAAFEVDALGIAAAGFVNAARSTVMFAPNIAWRDYPLRHRIAAALGEDVRVAVENDANAAGWAEFQFGVGRNVQDMVMLTVGTGLGGAVVSEGRLLRGAWGVAGEIGHMRVVPGGRECGCGQRGCWEQYASGRSLVRGARAAAAAAPERAARLLELAGGQPAAVTGPHVTTAAMEGDAFATELLAELGQWLGEGAATLAALLDPALVVIGGGVAAAGELLTRPAREAFGEHLSGRGHRPELRIELASLGNDAGLVGAADLARR